MLKEQKGVTLVALVITIIVLIILAGVSISMVIGNNGIATRAQEAEKLQANAAVHENQALANLEVFVNDTTR
ncbi:MAG: hypothetical protein ACLS95_00290 [Clostridia bacterium]